MAGPLVKKTCLLKDGPRRNGKREENLRQMKISDYRQHHDKWTVCRYEKEGCEEGRLENARLKDLWAENYD